MRPPAAPPDSSTRLTQSRSRSTRANGRAVPPGKCGRYLISCPGRGNRILGVRGPTSRPECDSDSPGAEGIKAIFKQSDDLRPACSGRENAAVESLERILGMGPPAAPDSSTRLTQSRSRSTRANGRAVPPGKCGRYLISRPGRGNRILGVRGPTSRPDCDADSPGAEGIKAIFKQSDDLRPACSGRENAAVESLERILGIPWAPISLGLFPWERVLGPLEANPWALGSESLDTLGSESLDSRGANPWNEILGLILVLSPLERILGTHSAVIG
jgi:hypothetical protein